MKTARELMGEDFPSWVDDEPGTSSVEWLLEEVARRARQEALETAAKEADRTVAQCSECDSGVDIPMTSLAARIRAIPTTPGEREAIAKPSEGTGT